MGVNFAKRGAHTVTDANMLCLEVYKNGTDHSRLRNCKKNIPLYSPEEGPLEFEPGPSRSAVECSTTELYTPRQLNFCFAFRRERIRKCPFLEIYRMGTDHFTNFLRCALTPSRMHANTFMIPMRSHTDA
ncbi:hypothetical protein TNCV_1684271 [Trichonephila clavipes]|nr:hypothetical protein TNCV_1684271 [Trichonephila clavipes]